MWKRRSRFFLSRIYGKTWREGALGIQQVLGQMDGKWRRKGLGRDALGPGAKVRCLSWDPPCDVAVALAILPTPLFISHLALLRTVFTCTLRLSSSLSHSS